jgi:hypothetical protein
MDQDPGASGLKIKQLISHFFGEPIREFPVLAIF